MAKSCIGLDIGSSAIKAVQVKQSKRGIQLINFGIEPVPSQSIVDGTIMNAGSVVDALRELFGKLKIRQKEVSVAISGHSVIIKKINVPLMTPEELEEQIRWEAEHHIPFAKDDVEIDYQIIQSERTQNQMEVLLVAAKKEVVSDYTSLVREAGLNPVVVDVAAFSLQNSFEASYGTPTETVALINVGASISTINILSKGISTFTRDMTIGGNSFTEEIQKSLNVSYDEAEAFKCGGTAGNEVVPKEVDDIMRRQAEVMAGEFQRSFDFFLATTSEGQIDKVYISGGSARVPALCKSIEMRARLPVELMNPFRGVTVDSKRFDMDYVNAQAPMAAMAVGLALRYEGDSV